MTYHLNLFVNDYFICNHALWLVTSACLDSLADQSKLCSDEVKKWSENVRCSTVISSSGW